MSLNVTPKGVLRVIIVLIAACFPAVAASDAYAATTPTQYWWYPGVKNTTPVTDIRYGQSPLITSTATRNFFAPGPIYSAGTSHTNIIPVLCIGCSVSSAGASHDGNINTAAQVQIGIGIAGRVGQRIVFPGTYESGDSIVLDFEVPTATLGLDVLGSIRVEAFNGASTSVSVTDLNNVVRLQALGAGVGPSGKMRAIIPVNATFDRVEVTTGALLSALGGLYIYEVTAVVPVTVTPAGNPVLTPAGTSAALTASHRLGAATFNWYDSPTGGTLLHTGATYNTAVLTRGKHQYWVAATTSDNKTSFIRTAVNVEVGGPGPLWTYGDEQNSPVLSGVCVGCTVSDPLNAVDADPASFSTLNTVLGVAGGVSQIIHFPGTYQAGDSIAIDLELPNSTLSVALLGGITLQSYNGNTANGDAVALNNSLVRLDVLGTGIGGSTGKVRITIPVNTAFDGVSVGTSAVLGGLAGLRIYEAAAFMPLTITPPAQTIPLGSTATMSASVRAGGATYTWYDVPAGGTPLATTASFTSPPLNRSKTYYAEASTPDGLKSYHRTAATVTVGGGPGPLWTYGDRQQSPVINGVCLGCTVTDADNAADANPATSSLMNVTVGALGGISQIIHFPGTYQAGDSIAVDIEIPNQNLSASLLGGVTLETYNGATPNGDAMLLNNSLVRVEPVGLGAGSTGKFRVTIPVNDTFDGVRIGTSSVLSGLSGLRIYEAVAFMPVTVTPPAPVIPAASTATMTASVRAPDATFNWYDTPTGGTPLATTTSYTTPTLSRSKKYYVSASTPDGLTSFQRTAVPVTVSGGPGPLWTYGDNQQSPIVGGVCLGCVVQNADRAVDADSTTASQAIMTVGALGSVGQLIHFPGTYQAGDSIAFILGVPAQNLSASLLSGIRVQTYIGNTPNGDAVTLDNSLLELQALGLDITGNVNKFRVTMPVTAATFDGVQVDLTGIVAGLSSLNIYEAAAFIPVTVTPANPTVLFGSDTTLNASIRLPGATFRWYDAPTGGTLLFTGADFNTPILVQDRTFYVEASTPDGLTSFVRTAVPVTVMVGPSSPDLSCGRGITQTTGTSGLCLLCSTTTPELAVDDNPTTASRLNVPLGLLGAGLYQRLAFGQESSPGDSLRIVVGSTTGLLNLSLLGNVTIRPRNNGVENTADARALNNGLLHLQLLDGGTRQVISFVPSQIFDEVDLRIDGIATALTEINVYYVQQITPMATVAADTVNVCSGQPATLNATTPSAATFRWYDAPSGGNLLFTGATYTTPAVTADGVYYVEAVSATTGCASEVRKPVFVKVGLSSVSVTTSSVTIPQGGTATFDVNTPSPAFTYNWYTVPTGGTPVFTGPSFTTGPLNATTTYYVEATTTTGCASAQRIAVVANVIITNPDVPCDIATSQISNANGLCIGCYIDNQGSAVDGSIQSFSTLHTILGLLGGYVQQTLIFSSPSDAGDSVRIGLSLPASLVDASLLGGIQIATYNGATYNNDRTALNTSLLNLQLLPGNQQAILTFAPSAVFDRVEIRLASGLAGALSAVNVHYASRFVPVPDVQPDTVSTCAGSTATLNVASRTNTIFRWYSAPTGGTLLFTGTTYQTGTLNADTAFYVEAAKTSNNCINPVRTKAVVTIGAAPVAPTLESTSVTTCGGTSATLRATAPAGATFRWYSQQTGGTALFTGAEFITPVLDSSAVYYAEAVSSGGCISTTRTAVQVSVSARPGTPDITPANATICAGGTATLTATSGTAGATFNWYADATLSTILFTGPSFTTPILNTSTTYYVVAANGQCVSAAPRAVTVVVNEIPVQPAVTINPVSGMVEYGQTAELTATSTTPGVTFRWYLDAAGTVPVFTGNPFVTPALAENTTYYVDAVGAGGCASARTAVTVNVNRDFNPGCDFANSQVSTVNGLCLGCTVNTPDNSVDTDTLNFANIQVPVALLGATVTHMLNFGSLAAAGDTVKVRMSFPTGLLDVSVLSAIQITSYRGGVSNNDPQLINSSAIQLNILSGTNQRAVLFSPGAAYDAIEIRVLGGVASALVNFNVHYANRILSSPVINQNNLTICAGTSATLTATASDSATVRWYTVPTGGTPVATGKQFSTGPLTTSITYYAESYRASTDCANPIRTPATVQVMEVPQLPVVLRGDTAICSGNNAVLIARAVNPVHTIRWYDAPTGGNLLSSDSVYTTAALTANKTFYAEAFNGTCGSATRVAVNVTVNTAPADPVLESNNVTICGNTTATLRVTSSTTGLRIRWYAVQSGGTPVFEGPVFITPTLSATTVYYVEAVNAGGGCPNAGGRIQATVNVNATPGIPVLVDPLRVTCSNQPVTLSVQNPVSGVTYNWYSAATGGTLLLTGATVTTPALTDTTTYFVEAVGPGNCPSTGRAIARISVQSALAAPTVESANVTVCRGSQATLRILNPLPGISYEWFDAPGGNRLFIGSEYTTGALVTNTIFYVRAVSAGGCTSATHTQVSVTATDVPALPVVTGTTTICAGGTPTLSIQNPQSGLTYTWFSAANGGTQLAQGTTFSPAGLTTNTTFFVEASGGTCTSAGRTSVTVTVSPVPQGVTVVAGTQTICSGGTATFQVQNPQAGITYRWYSSPTGGALLSSLPTFTTPALATNTNYYVEAVNANNCSSLTRTQVSVVITAGPAVPGVPAEVTACRGNRATVSVSSPQANIQYRWYETPTGGTPIFTGNTYTSDPLNARDTLYVEANVIGGTCTSNSRAQVIFIPSDAPATPVLVNGGTITVCSGSTATFSVQNPVPGVTYNWYDASTGGSLLQANASSYTTGTLTTNITVYVEASVGTGCTSTTRASATVTVGQVPTAPTVNADALQVCKDSSATLRATSNQAGVIFSWYAAATGGNALFTGPVFSTPGLAAPTTYYVAAGYDGGCMSATRTAITIGILEPLAAPTVTVANQTATSVTFQWNAIIGAIGYRVSTDGGITFTQPSSGLTGLTHTINNLQPNQSITLQVMAIGANECANSAWFLGDGGTDNPAGNTVFVPNAFTPNNDGLNDILYVYGTTISSMEIRIFNQWGQLVFESKDKGRGWDGTMSGVKQPIGVYNYVLKAQLQDGTVIQKRGTITLVR